MKDKYPQKHEGILERFLDASESITKFCSVYRLKRGIIPVTCVVGLAVLLFVVFLCYGILTCFLMTVIISSKTELQHLCSP